MNSFRARVEKGRLILDEPNKIDDKSADLSDEGRRALHEALSASWKSAGTSRARPASAILDKLRARR